MCTILIADDDTNILQGLRKILLDNLCWPKEILEASDGQQAFETLCSTPVDLVIADIKMPSMDGLTLLREIRNHQIPCEVLILSSYDDYSFVRNALKMEAFDYLLKPVNIHMLLQIMERMREKRQKRRLAPLQSPGVNQRSLPAGFVSIPFYDSAASVPQGPTHDPECCLKNALHSAAALKKEQTLEQLGAFFDAVAATQTAPDKVRSALTQWVYSLMKTNEAYIEIIGSCKLTPDDVINCVKSLPTLSQLRTRCMQIISNYIDRLQNRASKKQSDEIKQALDIIENSPVEEFTLNSIAQRLYMTPNTLSALFKAETGVSFRSYRVAFVIRRAKELLSQTNLSIAQISEMLGYRDVAHFSRAFKKETGMTPGKYRDMHPLLGDGRK